MSKKKLKAQALPQLTRAEVEEKIGAIAIEQAKVTKLQADADRRIAQIQQQLAEALVVPNAFIAANVDLVLRWADANRADLCAKDSKTVKFATGEVAWRLDPPSVSVPKKPEKLKAIVKALLKKKLRRFVRVKFELDKEAILKEPEKIAGVEGLTINQAETISLKPNQVGIEPIELSMKAAAE
jgi:phage host-nuclease inhibitor protein Gam